MAQLEEGEQSGEHNCSRTLEGIQSAIKYVNDRSEASFFFKLTRWPQGECVDHAVWGREARLSCCTHTHILQA